MSWDYLPVEAACGTLRVLGLASVRVGEEPAPGMQGPHPAGQHPAEQAFPVDKGRGAASPCRKGSATSDHGSRGATADLTH